MNEDELRYRIAEQFRRVYNEGQGSGELGPVEDTMSFFDEADLVIGLMSQ